MRVFDTRRVAEEGTVERDKALEAARGGWNQHQAKLVANVSTSNTTYFVVVSNIRVGGIHDETAQHFEHRSTLSKTESRYIRGRRISGLINGLEVSCVL